MSNHCLKSEGDRSCYPYISSGCHWFLLTGVVNSYLMPFHLPPATLATRIFFAFFEVSLLCYPVLAFNLSLIQARVGIEDGDVPRGPLNSTEFARPFGKGDDGRIRAFL